MLLVCVYVSEDFLSFAAAPESGELASPLWSLHSTAIVQHVSVVRACVRVCVRIVCAFIVGGGLRLIIP